MQSFAAPGERPGAVLTTPRNALLRLSDRLQRYRGETQNSFGVSTPRVPPCTTNLDEFGIPLQVSTLRRDRPGAAAERPLRDELHPEPDAREAPAEGPLRLHQGAARGGGGAAEEGARGVFSDWGSPRGTLHSL